MDKPGAPTHQLKTNQAAMKRGEAFKSEILARASKLGIFTDAALATAAGISPNTLRNWWQGRGLELGTLVAVAGVIDTSVFDLLDVWQGAKTSSPERTLASAITEWTAELRDAREERIATDGRLFAVEAELKSLRALQEAGAHGGQPAPHGATG